jgi:GT2 family glycosyltransferase
MLLDDKLAAVGSVIVYADREWIKFDGDYYNPKQKRLDSSFNAQSRLTGQVNGSGMLVRLAAIQKDGWFDERFFCYGEETEWCWRMSNCGWNIATAMSSIIYHRTEGSNTNGNALYYRNRNQFLRLQQEQSSRVIGRKARLIRGMMGSAYNYWNSADLIRYHAVLAALRDGLLGRFGRREERPLGFCWIFAGGVYMWLVWLSRKSGIRPDRIHLLWKKHTGSIFMKRT